jgi:hypothetical protein
MAAKNDKASEVADPGPWWVEDSQTGHRFATYYVPEGVKVLPDESPWADAGNGVLRAAEPRGAKPAVEAATEGNQK